jgi:hypothetical protein
MGVGVGTPWSVCSFDNELLRHGLATRLYTPALTHRRAADPSLGADTALDHLVLRMQGDV